VACTASTPQATPSQTEQAQGSPIPTATPIPPIKPARSVSQVGAGVAASGDFRGNGKSQIALLETGAGDASLQIAVREPSADGDTFTESVWLTSGPNTFRLNRAKFTVADVTADGKDDLIALYDESEYKSGLLVFRSTGSSFSPAEKWWDGANYDWVRARAILGGNFSGNGHDGVMVAYQYDNFQMRIHYFESTGSAFNLGGTQGAYDSGPAKFDLSLARFAVGRFTRTGGAQQIAALYQSPNAKARMLIFDPNPNGLALMDNVYATNEGEYDLSRASISAGDVTGDGRDDLVAVYGDADGSAKVQVFDSGSSFKPANGLGGWASLPAGAACAGATAVLLGDWNGDRRVDVGAIAPADGVLVHSNLLRNMGGGFKVTSTSEEVVCPRWPLTGMPLAGGSASKRPLYVKIDNNPHARPHYSINKADQVYEWLVEGLTTRLAAVFQSKDPDVIGSVRSARMTDTPIIPSLNAAFVYSGGGPEELMKLHYDAAVVDRYIDLAPGYGWGYRVGFREAPYNYFTTYKNLQDALAGAPDGDQPVSIPSWNFLPASVTDPLAGGMAGSIDATSITIPYRALFTVGYRYDAASGSYARFQDGVREVDGQTNQAVAAKNIVVIQTEVHFTTDFGLDPAGNPKLDMTLVGAGNGSVFRDGKRQDITWTRPDIFDVFTLRNSNGEAVRLDPGQTWIHIVPADWTIPSS
ncbi:MAG TPA: DUF3048 domain-containing protein, partial [Candidatus Polarisedimenticolia bacterium]|nr:DUF3048 domain-containing protein [Candidatus Polarisedimenticolia bacterium]